MMQVTCKVRGREIRLKNPLMTAPGGFGNILEYQGFNDLEKLGALIPNSMLSQDGSPNRINKFLMLPHGYLSSFGPNNMGLKTFIQEVLPKLPPDAAPVIVDLKAKSMEEMEESVALAAETEKIWGIEINLNCPYASAEAPYYRDAKKLEKLVTGARKAAGEKLLIAKAPGGIYPMQEMADVLEAGGMDMFVPFNCIDGCAVDIRTGKVQGGGYFGAGIKPVAMARLREAAAVFKIPVIGAGGITCAADVLEYLMLGAFAVQVGSANLTRPDFIMRLLGELEALVRELGIEDLDKIRGSAG